MCSSQWFGDGFAYFLWSTKMAFNNAASQTTTIAFSSFLGGMYIDNEGARRALKEVKAAIGGDEVIKAGFTGKTGASAEAVRMLREKGVDLGSMTGRLVRVVHHMVDVKGTPTDYLRVVVDDGEEKYSLSTALSGRGAQMLVRKLHGATPWDTTTISLFCKKNEYVDQVASVKQRGEEIKGVSPQDVLLPRIEVAKKALIGAGIPLTDKKTHSNRRGVVEMEYHLELLKEIEARFKDHANIPPQEDGHSDDYPTDPDGLPSAHHEDDHPF
jgi:hypothetical protein